MLGRVIGTSSRFEDRNCGENNGGEDDEASTEELKRRAKLGMVVDMSESSWVGGLIPSEHA